MGNDNKGWIALYRSIEDSFLWKDKPFSKGQAWIDLLLLANHEDNKIMYQGEVITCERGTVNRSILSLAERWGWDRKTVRNFLKVLESDGMVTINATTHRTTITLINYGVYQDYGTTKRTTKRTTKSQQDGQQSPINNNDNNVNNENNIYIPSRSKHKYGTYNNVLLTDDELEKLKGEYIDWENKIENLSEGIALKGYKYKSHYLAIRKWAENDNKKGKEELIVEKQRRELQSSNDDEFPIY